MEEDVVKIDKDVNDSENNLTSDSMNRYQTGGFWEALPHTKESPVFIRVSTAKPLKTLKKVLIYNLYTVYSNIL